ncbi:MAG: Conserved hypothetical secreted protein [Rhodocyclales bacterium]|nr:Conserved hypothetical secreted protein [Rhodocyclales bacterium]
MFRLRSLSPMVIVLLIAACASFSSIQPGQTLGSEVIARQGKPTHIWPEPDGGRTLEYSSQPFGVTSYMVRVGADDHVQRVENTLAPEGLARVQTGMTREEIGHLLGTPRSKVNFSLSKEEVWDWTIPGTLPGDYQRFNVHFVDGKVVRTSRSRVDRDDMCNSLMWC